MAQGPQGERGQQGEQGPEGPRGSIGLKTALALMIVGFGVAAGIIVTGIFGSNDTDSLALDRQGGIESAIVGEFGTPGSPQLIQDNIAYPHYDVQIHNRNSYTNWDGTMNAQHTDMCAAPPGTHIVDTLPQGVFICNDHVMTAVNSGGYGEIVLTPTQVLDCSVACSATFDISTERQSSRDWWELRLTPWLQNVALPFASDLGADLQGAPANYMSVDLNNGQSYPHMMVVNNNVVTEFGQFPWPICDNHGTDGCTPAINENITAGTNQAAVRQTFKLTITPGHMKFERLSSVTAPGIIFQDRSAPVAMRNDYIVQFEHHSYNPTKDGAGVPATWHWSGLGSSPSTPFTLIHMVPQCTGCANPMLVTANSSTVQFPSPAPANSYLRFSGICRVLINDVLAERQTFYGATDHASSYFIPLAQGAQNVNVKFAPDGAYSGPCAAQDFHIWSKSGGAPPPTPTPTVIVPPTLTPTPVVPPTATPIPPTPPPNATPTPTALPTVTSTPIVPTPTVVNPTATPNLGPVRTCTLRWGNNTIETYGNLTQAQCAARGN